MPGLSNLYMKLLFARKIQFVDGQLILVDMPFVVTPVTFFSYLLKDAYDRKELKHLYDIFKASLFEVFSYEFQRRLGFNKSRLADWLKEFGYASGWGKIEFLNMDFEKKRAIVRVENNPVALSLLRKVNQPICYHMAAFLAGGASRAFGTEVDCTEVKCMALGEKYCEFIIKVKE